MEIVKTIRAVELVKTTFKSIFFILIFILILIVMIVSKVKLLFIIGYLIVAGGIVTLMIMYIKNTAKVNLSERSIEDIIANKSITNRQAYSNERIIDAVFGIVKTFRGSRPGIGAAKYLNPENSLLFTNYRIMFVVIPVAGAEYGIQNMDFATLNAMFLRGNIERLGNEMISNMNPYQILSCHENNFAVNYKDIESVKISKFFRTLKIKTKEKTYKYTLFNYGHIKKLKELFSQITPNKM